MTTESITLPIVTATPVSDADDTVTITMNAHAAELLREIIEQHHANTRRPVLAASLAPSFQKREVLPSGGVVEWK